LYVTALEIAWMVRQLPDQSIRQIDRQGLITTDGCPFQLDRCCTIHALRPLGCRVFFCDRSTDPAQSRLYENYLADLRHLHDEHHIAYRYLEWRAGLAECLAHAGP
jgi:Fe-S-cluster containining protein